MDGRHWVLAVKIMSNNTTMVTLMDHSRHQTNAPTLVKKHVLQWMMATIHCNVEMAEIVQCHLQLVSSPAHFCGQVWMFMVRFQTGVYTNKYP